MPNYNYEQYIDQRLQTISQQNYPLYEIIFLDDCSRDKSLNKARHFLNKSSIDNRVLWNNKNSGRVISQWKKGTDLASGDYIWIAEADDYSEHNFLSETIKFFDDPKVTLSFCQSFQSDSGGKILAGNYLKYTEDVDPNHWNNDFINVGNNEIRRYLSIKNTIPNVSAVIFNKASLKKALKISKVLDYSFAHDWFIYFNVIKRAKIGFCSKSLNFHRRHNSSLIGRNLADKIKLINEIKRMQTYISSKEEIPIRTKIKMKNYILELEKTFISSSSKGNK